MYNKINPLTGSEITIAYSTGHITKISSIQALFDEIRSNEATLCTSEEEPTVYISKITIVDYWPGTPMRSTYTCDTPLKSLVKCKQMLAQNGFYQEYRVYADKLTFAQYLCENKKDIVEEVLTEFIEEWADFSYDQRNNCAETLLNSRPCDWTYDTLFDDCCKQLKLNTITWLIKLIQQLKSLNLKTYSDIKWYVEQNASFYDIDWLYRDNNFANTPVDFLGTLSAILEKY